MKPFSIDKGLFGTFSIYWDIGLFSGSIRPRLRGRPNEEVSLLAVLQV